MKWFLLIWITAGCVSSQGVRTVTYRDPNLLIKGMPKVPEVSLQSGIAKDDDAEIYVKTSDVMIKENHSENRGGSLYQPKDRRHDWFRDQAPYQVGDSIVIRIDQNRARNLKAEQPGDNEKNEDKKEESLEDELLKNFPSLAPEPDSGLSVIRSFRAQIVSIKPNGDAVVVARRSSKANKDDREYSVRSLVSARILQEEDEITTKHLNDVDFYENDGSQVLKSHSSDWQDEYTLRMSGFNESQSKYAAELESQRKDLDSVREKLRERLESFGKERRQIAKERDDLLGDKRKFAEQIQKLESELTQKKQSITDLKSQIRELDEARPGEEQDAEDGE
ncbi:MAG: flagellar basal body L-ring protein FlgH [Oligoflexales bacterium]